MTRGFYSTILSTVEVDSGWSERMGVWGKGQERIGAATHRVRQRLLYSSRRTRLRARRTLNFYRTAQSTVLGFLGISSDNFSMAPNFITLAIQCVTHAG